MQVIQSEVAKLQKTIEKPISYLLIYNL